MRSTLHVLGANAKNVRTHCHSVDIYPFISQSIDLFPQAFTEKKKPCVRKGKWVFHLFQSVSRSLYTMAPSDDPTLENCRKNIFLSLLAFSSLYVTYWSWLENDLKVFLRRIASENLSLNKKSGRSEHLKYIWFNTWIW